MTVKFHSSNVWFIKNGLDMWDMGYYKHLDDPPLDIKNKEYNEWLDEAYKYYA